MRGCVPGDCIYTPTMTTCTSSARTSASTAPPVSGLPRHRHIRRGCRSLQWENYIAMNYDYFKNTDPNALKRK